MTTPFEEVRLRLPHIELAAHLFGPEDGQPVIALHGWLDNANSFLPLAEKLPQLQLVAIDLPGHGQSDHRSPDAHYHFLDWVDDVVQLLHLLQLSSNQPVVLIGHSMGGMIATAVAASFPELVRQVILLDSIGLVTGAEQDTVSQLRKALLSRQKRLDKRKPQYPDLNAAAAARQAQSDFDLATAVLLAERGTVSDGVTWTWSADLRLREVSAYRLSEAQACQFIESVKAPALAIMAKQGIELMQQGRQRWQPHYQNLQLYELDAGHHLHMTHSIEVAAKISSFLASFPAK